MNILNVLKGIAYSLVLLGALNWGFVGAFNFDLVSFLFGDMSIISRIIYGLIGISAIAYLVFSLREKTDCECEHSYQY